MKDPVSPNRLFEEVQKDISSLSDQLQIHAHHGGFFPPPEM